MAYARFRLDAALVAILLAAGCGGDERDEEPNGGGGPGDDGATADDGADDGETGDDDGATDDGATDDGATGDDGTTGGDTTGDGTDDVPPGECPPSGKPAPTGCWSAPPGEWDDVRCGCGPAISQTGGPDGAAEDISQCSAYADVGQLFDEINQIRDQYVDSGMTLCHSRYRGIPWEGENAGMTWPSYFTWDDCLAGQAQALAEDIAAGNASHGGTAVDGQNGCCEDFYMDNMFEDDFRITFDESSGGNSGFALSQGNGSARMGLFYADFDGDGPVIQQLGMGASVGASCKVTWVLQFGP